MLFFTPESTLLSAFQSCAGRGREDAKRKIFGDVGQLRSDTGREGGALRARSTSEILYAFRAKSRKFLPWRGRVAERLSRAFRAIPRATRGSACGTDVSATSRFRVEIPRSFLKICVSTFAPPLPPRKAFRVRVPRDSEMRFRGEGMQNVILYSRDV